MPVRLRFMPRGTETGPARSFMSLSRRFAAACTNCPVNNARAAQSSRTMVRRRRRVADLRVYLWAILGLRTRTPAIWIFSDTES
jgi:hypothetical protein